MNLAELRPLHDQVIVQRKAPDKMTAGGLHIPRTQGRWGSNYIKDQMRARVSQGERDYELEGEVIAVGSGRELKNGTRAAPCVKPGDYVYFLDDGEDLPGEIGERLVMLKEEHIIGVRE